VQPRVGAKYHIPWEVLAGIAANECDLGRSNDPSCTLQPGATGPGVANSAGASGLMQIGIGGASGDAYQRLQPYLPNLQLGPHDPTTAVQLAALTLLKLKGAPQDAAIAAYAPYVTAYNGTGPAAVAYGQRVIADAQSYQGNGTTGVASGCQTTAGNFSNPLAGDTHVVAERIDMGVDYADPAAEPIGAIGAGTVTYAGPQGGGWQPNCINYTLGRPPAPTQRYVYVCEHISPTVHVGQTVEPGQQIATFIPGGGIETGFAAAPGNPVSTRAAQLGQQAQTGDAGNNRTYCGQAMSDLIQHAGGPAGLTEGRAIVGTQC
jgi:Peptidase family M23